MLLEAVSKHEYGLKNCLKLQKQKAGNSNSFSWNAAKTMPLNISNILPNEKIIPFVVTIQIIPCRCFYLIGST